MANIQEYLNKIKNAVYGKEVRQAIYDGIHQCYEDGKAGAIDLVAREDIAACDNDIKAVNDDVIELKMLGWNVPSDFPIQNTVSGNIFTQKVGRVDLSTLGFGYASSLFQYSFSEAKKPSANNVVANIMTSNYRTVFYYSGGQGVSTNDDSIALDMNGKLYIHDNSYTDVNTFKNAMQGVYLYYELATPITMNINNTNTIDNVNNQIDVLKNNASNKFYKWEGQISSSAHAISYPSGFNAYNTAVVCTKIRDASNTSKFTLNNGQIKYIVTDTSGIAIMSDFSSSYSRYVVIIFMRTDI